MVDSTADEIGLNQSPFFNDFLLESLNNACQSDILMQIDFHLAAKNFLQAEVLLNFLSQKNPDNSEFLVKLGHLMYQLQNYAKAEKYYKKAIEKNSKEFREELCFGLGQCCFAIKNYSESYSAYLELVENHADFRLICLVNLKIAKILIFYKEFESASVFCMKSLKKSNSPQLLVEALCCLGNICELQEKKKSSIRLYFKAFNLLKNFCSVSHVAWGYLEESPEKSEAICKRFMNEEMSPIEWSDICFLQAIASVKQKKFDHAVELLELLTRLHPTNHYYSQYLAIAYFSLGLQSQASDIFQKISAIFPYNITNLFNLSLAYAEQGLFLEASHAFLQGQMVMGKGPDPEKFKKLTIITPKIDISEFPLNFSENV